MTLRGIRVVEESVFYDFHEAPVARFFEGVKNRIQEDTDDDRSENETERSECICGWMVLGVLIVVGAGVFAETSNPVNKPIPIALGPESVLQWQVWPSPRLARRRRQDVRKDQTADPENDALKSVEQNTNASARISINGWPNRPIRLQNRGGSAPAGTADKLPAA